MKGLCEGEASSYLPIMHFCLLSYSKIFAEYIVDLGFDLLSKDDFSFVESVFHILRHRFNYRPVLKIGQFLATGYAERKIMMMLDLIGIVKTKTIELKRHQQVDEKKSRSPSRLNHEESIKVKTPPRPSSKAYKDTDEILMNYSHILRGEKNTMSFAKLEDPLDQELSDESDSNNVIESLKKNVACLQEDNKKLNLKVEKLEQKLEITLVQYEAKIHLLTSKIKMLENNYSERDNEREREKEREKEKKVVTKPEKKSQEEGLLSKLGISSSQLAYKGIYENITNSFENY